MAALHRQPGRGPAGEVWETLAVHELMAHDLVYIWVAHKDEGEKDAWEFRVAVEQNLEPARGGSQVLCQVPPKCREIWIRHSVAPCRHPNQ